ncbi:hypothetical protein B7463_g11543, partial [Scytalidium lignicola]
RVTGEVGRGVEGGEGLQDAAGQQRGRDEGQSAAGGEARHGHVRCCVLVRPAQHVLESILNIMDCSGEKVLWSYAVLDIEHSVAGGRSDVPTEAVVQAVQVEGEAGAIIRSLCPEFQVARKYIYSNSPLE